MTKQQFKNAPGLLREKDVVSLGYARVTLHKFAECGLLKRVKPFGCAQVRYQKRQLAQLLEWPEVVAADEARFAKEPVLMRRAAILQWLGIGKETLDHMTATGALKLIHPAGFVEGKCPKEQIAALLGMPVGV